MKKKQNKTKQQTKNPSKIKLNSGQNTSTKTPKQQTKTNKNIKQNKRQKQIKKNKQTSKTKQQTKTK